MDSISGSYVISNFRNTGKVKFIKPNDLKYARSRTPMNQRVGKSSPFETPSKPSYPATPEPRRSPPSGRYPLLFVRGRRAAVQRGWLVR